MAPGRAARSTAGRTSTTCSPPTRRRTTRPSSRRSSSRRSDLVAACVRRSGDLLAAHLDRGHRAGPRRPAGRARRRPAHLHGLLVRHATSARCTRSSTRTTSGRSCSTARSILRSRSTTSRSSRRRASTRRSPRSSHWCHARSSCAFHGGGDAAPALRRAAAARPTRSRCGRDGRPARSDPARHRGRRRRSTAASRSYRRSLAGAARATSRAIRPAARASSTSYVGKTGGTYDAEWPAFLAICCADGPNLSVAAMPRRSSGGPRPRRPDFGAAERRAGLRVRVLAVPADADRRRPRPRTDAGAAARGRDPGDPATPFAWAEVAHQPARHGPARHRGRHDPHVEPQREPVPRRDRWSVPGATCVPPASGTALRRHRMSPTGSADRRAAGNLTARQISHREDTVTLVAEPDAAGTGAARTEIPMIVSVDDHVVEPPHLWQTLAPGASSASAGPKVERRGIGDDAPHRRRRLRADLRPTTARRPTAGSTRTSSTSTSATWPRSASTATT